MIIFGTRASEIGEHPLTASCTSCKEQTLVASYWQRLFHIFWIPVFPLKKFSQVFCTSCGTVYDGDHLQPELSQAAKKYQPRTPKWTYSGLIVIALLIGAGVASEHFDEKEGLQNTKLYLAAPQANDLYLVRMDIDGKLGYVFMRLEKASDNVLTFAQGKVMYNRATGASKDLRRIRSKPQ